MKKKLLILMSCVLCGQYCHSQTTTHLIDYTTAGLSSSSCNVFATPTIVGSYTHQTSFGNPNFNGNALVLFANTYSSTKTYAEQYGTNFPFIKNYRYKLEMDANMQIVAGNGYNFPELIVNAGNTNDGTNTNTACVDPPLVSLDKLNNYPWHNLLAQGTLHTTVIFDGWLPTQNYSHLLISNYFSDNNVPASFIAYIRKIWITETPPFQLTPKTVDICTNISQIFTVTPNFTVSNITSYVWNLGGTNNGWLLFDGSPAPATITTTSNSLTLKVAGTKTPNNIFVTINYNGTSVNTNLSTPLRNPSSTVVVTGSTSICNTTGVVYSLNSALPAIWSTNPTGIVNQSCINCNPTTLTKLTNGTFTLTAAVSGCKTASKQIYSGATVVANSITGPSTACPSSYVNYSVPAVSEATNYNWILPTGWTIIAGQGTPILSATTSQSVTGTVRVRISNACGEGPPALKSVSLESFCMNAGKRYSIFPNPASNSITITSSSANKTTTEFNSGFTLIQIVDKLQNVRKQSKYSTPISTTEINVSELPTDVYILRIFDGHTWTNQQLIIKRK